MENFNSADDAVHGVSDISGVKDVSLSRPEGETVSVPCVADTDEANAEGTVQTDMEMLEAEFDGLINGRFKEVYKRRTEGIIRKRLRAGKARPEKQLSGEKNADGLSISDTSENSESTEIEVTGSLEKASESIKASEAKIKSACVSSSEADSKAELARAKNKSRPIENGLGGSCGVVTKINVSALSGRDVISILRRVGTGEKISFK